MRHLKVALSAPGLTDSRISYHSGHDHVRNRETGPAAIAPARETGEADQVATRGHCLMGITLTGHMGLEQDFYYHSVLYQHLRRKLVC